MNAENVSLVVLIALWAHYRVPPSDWLYTNAHLTVTLTACLSF